MTSGSGRPIHVSVTLYSSSSDSGSSLASGLGDGPLIPDETSSLLKPKHAHENEPTISELRHSSLSSFIDNNAGLLLVAASQLFASAMNLMVKVLNSLDEPVPTLEMLLARMLITYMCSIAYMYWKKIPDPLLGPKGVRTLLVFRGLTGFFGISGLYFSLQYLSLSDAMVLTFLVPILTGFSGAVFLKEPLSLRELLAGLCSFFGVLLIARPRFLFGSLKMFSDGPDVTPTQRMLSVIVGIIGVIGATGAYTLIRRIGKRAHVLHFMMSFSSQSVLASTLGMILFRFPLVIPTHTSWLAMLLLIGIFGFVGQILLTMGLQRETAGRGTLAIYSSIVFAVMFEFIVFHTTPPALSIIGTVIIVSSAIYITLTKKRVTQPDTTPNRPASNHDIDP